MNNDKYQSTRLYPLDCPLILLLLLTKRDVVNRKNEGVAQDSRHSRIKISFHYLWFSERCSKECCKVSLPCPWWSMVFGQYQRHLIIILLIHLYYNIALLSAKLK